MTHPPRPNPSVVRTEFANRTITRPVFLELISKLETLDENRYSRVTHAGIIATGLVRNSARWADAALLSMLSGSHGRRNAEACAEAITGEPGVVIRRRAANAGFTIEFQSFGLLCVKRAKFGLLKAVAEFPDLMGLGGREFHAAVSGTTDAGRILDTVSMSRSSFLAMAQDMGLMSLCASMYPLECVQLLMDVDSDHPDLRASSDNTLRRHIAEERRRRHALAAEELMRERMQTGGIQTRNPRARRSMGL